MAAVGSKVARTPGGLPGGSMLLGWSEAMLLVWVVEGWAVGADLPVHARACETREGLGSPSYKEGFRLN